MSQQKKQKGQRSILRDSLSLVGSGGVVQVVAFLLLPIISHLYAPDLLGILGLFTSVSGVLSIASGGRYEQAIVTSSGKPDRQPLLWLTLLINAAFFVVTFFLALVLRNGFLPGKYVALNPYLLLLPLTIFSMGVYNTLSANDLSRGNFPSLAIAKTAQGLGNNLLKILFAIVLGASVGGLIGALLCSYAMGIVCLLQGCRIASIPSWGELRTVAKAYSAFPRFGIVQSGIDYLLGSLLVLLLPQQFGMQEIGWITMAIMLASRPLQVISDGVSGVYFHRTSEMVNARHPLMPMVKTFLYRWFLVATPLALLLFFLLPWMVGILLEATYAPTAKIIRLMLPMLLFRVPCTIFNILPDVLRKQRTHMWIQIGLLVGQLGVLSFSLYYGLSFAELLLFYYGSVTLLLVSYGIWLLYITKQYDRTNIYC